MTCVAAQSLRGGCQLPLAICSAGRAGGGLTHGKGAGVIVLLHGGRGTTETPVWVESSPRVRTRLEELLSIPQDDTPALVAILNRGHLRFRAASVAAPARRDQVVALLHERVDHLPLPAQVTR